VLACPAVTPVFFAQPLFLSALVRQDGRRSKTTLLATQAMSMATLSLTLSKRLLLYLRKLKVLKALILCSPSFAGITSSPLTESLPQVLAAYLGKDGICGRSAPKLTVDAAQDLSSASLVLINFYFIFIFIYILFFY
jgi:hypothetical protein